MGRPPKNKNKNLDNIKNLNINNGLLAMKALANNEYTSDEINQIISEGSNRYNAFMLSRAKHELSNVVVLTEFLDELEAEFMRTVRSRINDGSLSMKQYASILETTSNLLASSTEILNSVLKDDSLTMVLTTELSQDPKTPTISQASIISKLDDPQSRERVRNAIEQILKQSVVNPTPDAVVTDYKEIKEEDSENDV